MATLFNTKIKDTYQSLLKLEDNTILTTTTKNVTDGLGNASPLYMSTTRIGVGTNSPIATLDVNGAARINGALTLPQINAVFLTVGTFTWFADVNNILRLVSGGQNRLNLGTDGVLTTNAYYGSQIGSNTNPEAYSYSIAGNLQVDGVNRNLSNVNKNIFLAQTTGVGSVQNAPILRYFYAVKGAVTGFTSYRGIEIADLDSYFGTTSGNVMIGTTTNAGYKLDVNGTARFSGAVTADISNGTFGGIILDYNGGTRRIRPSGNSLDLTDVNGLKAFQVNQSSNPRIALQHDGVDFVRGIVSLQYTMGSTQQMVLSATNYVGHLTPFFDIKATGYANSKNTDLRLYTDNTTSGTYGNIIIGHNGTNATGNVGVGEASPTARLQVKGSGSTSATTALLVQNSSATTTLSVNDAGTVTTGGDIFAGNIQIGKGKSTGIYNVAMGQYALAGIVGSSTSAYTTAIGQAAGGNIASGNHNVIIGAEVAQQSTGMSSSVLIGSKIFGNVTSAINNTLAIGTGNTSNYYPTIYATNINTDSPNVRIGNNSALTAAVPTAPTASAILELSSTTKGFLPPQMTTAQKNAIATPANGLMVYDTDLARPCFFNGATWITL